MTLKQKQALLAYLGYYDGPLDGLWGEKSQRATRAFQADYGLIVDGIPGAATQKMLIGAIAGTAAKVERPSEAEQEDTDKPNTGTFWDEIEFFDREEFRCQCKGKYCNGFPVEPQENTVRTVNEIRRRLGVPVQIGSGVRCPVHNANVGGVANSNHLDGNAADLHSEKSPQEMARVAEEVMGNTGEIGIYDWGIHVGVNCKYSRFCG